MPRRAALRAAGSASRARLRLGFCSQERRTDTVSGAGSGEQRRKHAVGRFRRVGVNVLGAIVRQRHEMIDSVKAFARIIRDGR